ncbi:MAG: Beta-lactamase [Clostridiales bacterium]|jgi:CubicO group peptidase (beta-lactamase class C family)|nr:Beta-lactamase [Clostridiales bacterium]
MSINKDKLNTAINLIPEAIQKGFFPGVQVVIGHKNGVYKSESFGKRCIYPEILPLDNNTLFDMASLTKVMATTMVFIKFLEAGLISLYDRVGYFLEDFKGEQKDDITILNLLTHTAGFTPFKPLHIFCRDYEDSIKYICSSDLEYKPGTNVVYSDFSYIMLAYILEKIGKEGLDKLSRKCVFEPLDMNNTCFNPSRDNIAATEIDPTTNEPLIGIVHDENARFLGGISGHAGLFSNIEDVSKFANMLINCGKGFMSPLAFDAMIRNYTKGMDENRGIGWCIKGNELSSGGDLISPSAFGHTGFTGTSLWVDVENDVYVGLLTNRVHPTRDNLEIIKFRRVFHNAVLAAVE